MAHPVVHFEVTGADGRQLANFYAGLLGWQPKPVPGSGYTLVDTCAGAGVNGGIADSQDGESSATFYVEADDLQAVLDKVNLLGGKTQTPITELPGMVTFARFEDLDGLVVGLILGPGGQLAAAPGQAAAAAAEPVPGPSVGTGAPADWFEIAGADADRSQRFYAEIFGWQAADSDGDSGQVNPAPEYRMIDTCSDRGIRGGIGPGRQGPWATVYARVPDVEAALARAVELGGTREYGPVAVDDHMQTGAVRDPAGNVFGVYSHAPH
jgi:predicted enzyme related to lactoylglutathione lyase